MEVGSEQGGSEYGQGQVVVPGTVLGLLFREERRSDIGCLIGILGEIKDELIGFSLLIQAP